METVLKNITTIIQESLNNTISYEQYDTLINELVEQRKTTGADQNEDMVYYTKLNAQRSKRLNKTIGVDASTQTLIKGLDSKYTWLVLTESWCGDAAQTLPLLNKLAVLNPNIDLQLVLRDENIELMEQFLTKGGRSIPKLIMLDERQEVVGSWGPRPMVAQEVYDAWKNDPNKVPYKEFQVEMQKWYLKDKGQTTINEIAAIIKELPLH
jgi:hypothetical protein